MPLIASNPTKRVILGLMTFGPPGTKARITSLDDFNACLDYFQSKGYNEVDTAHLYVNTEQQAWTRKARWEERGLKLATKYYPNQDEGGHTAANLRAKLEWNLEQLGAKCVDIFYLHAADRHHNFTETLEECNRMHKEGKFVELGLSNFTAFEVAECVMICNERGWVRPTIYQGMLNLITRALEHETVIACHRYGMQVVVYNPLAGGLLTGRIKSKEDVPNDTSRFGNESSSAANYRHRYFRDGVFEAIQMIRETAEKHQLTMAEISLRWVMHHSTLNIQAEGGDGILIGVSSKEQLESNLADCERGPLPQEVVDVCDQAWLRCKATTPNYWHLDLEYGYDTKKALFGDRSVH